LFAPVDSGGKYFLSASICGFKPIFHMGMSRLQSKAPRSLLALEIPGRCPCGQPYPFSPQSLKCFPLALADDAIFNNDPQIAENMLVSYRAAQRYNYDIQEEHVGAYLVTNPKKGGVYSVGISEDGDSCECDVFCGGGDTCIHIEHVRLRLGLPSTSLLLSEQQRFAYAPAPGPVSLFAGVVLRIPGSGTSR
jgi:hypothetical protein